jgi:amino acid transporter
MSDASMGHAVEPGAETTALGLAEKRKLVKSLRRVDMFFFTLCAFVGLDTLGIVASNGAQGFTWLIVLAVLFVLPYALLMAEVGSAFTQEGGAYEWVKMAFGRFHGSITAVLYWITNPLWVGGSLAFLATEAWDANVFGIAAGSAGDYVFKLLFVWLSIGAAIASLRRGKWIPNAGAIMRVLVLGFFTLTACIYAAKHGIEGFPVSDLTPTTGIFFALVPLLLFNYVGFELQSGAAEEMENPQRDVPLSVIRSAVAGIVLYAIPIFAILMVLPASKLTGIGGFIDAVSETFTVYGGASSFMLGVMTVGFVFTLMTSGAVWMIGSDRTLAVAAYDGAFPKFFGIFNAKLGTPVRVNVFSGIVATIFMVVALAAFSGGSDSKFVVVLTIAITTTLMSYLWVFPAAVKLRFSRPDVPRPYRVPFGNAGMLIAGGLTTFWVALGSWTATFPGTLESLFGVDYDFVDVWGVSRATFTLLTLGTLAVVLLIAVVGYALGADVRRETVVAPVAAEADPAGATA